VNPTQRGVVVREGDKDRTTEDTHERGEPEAYQTAARAGPLTAAFNILTAFSAVGTVFKGMIHPSPLPSSSFPLSILAGVVAAGDTGASPAAAAGG
jgi:hypothetical protein